MQSLEGAVSVVPASGGDDAGVVEFARGRKSVNGYGRQEAGTESLLPTRQVCAGGAEEDDGESEIVKPTGETPTAETVRVVMTAIKFFIGSGVLFLPKAFAAGGWAFATGIMAGMAALTQLTILRLVECRQKQTGSFSHLGYVAYGNLAKWGVDLALILAQGGFCCVYIAFIARNVLQLLNMNTCWVQADKLWLLVLLQFPIFLPLSWIRRIQYLSIPSLVANGLTFVGLGAILLWSWVSWGASGSHTAEHAVLFNADDFPLFLGTAVYAYEGLGLIVPLYDSLSPAGQARFPRTLSVTLVIVATMYTTVGLFPYLYIAGVANKTMQDSVTLNLPRVWWAYLIIAFYCLALLLTYPLQLFPVLRIMERGLLACNVRRGDDKDVWVKNAARGGAVAITLLVSYLGSSQLNNLVALVGCFACTPLAFIFPCLFHLKLVGGTMFQRVSNVIIILFGLAVFVFSTYEAIKTWGETTVEPCLLTPGYASGEPS